jgi:hypothetical protein
LQDQSQILFQTYTVQKKPSRTNPKFTLPDLHGSKKTLQDQSQILFQTYKAQKNLAGPIPNSLFQTYTVQKKPSRTNPKFTLPDLHGSKKNLAGPIPNSLPDLQG